MPPTLMAHWHSSLLSVYSPVRSSVKTQVNLAEAYWCPYLIRSKQRYLWVVTEMFSLCDHQHLTSDCHLSFLSSLVRPSSDSSCLPKARCEKLWSLAVSSTSAFLFPLLTSNGTPLCDWKCLFGRTKLCPDQSGQTHTSQKFLWREQNHYIFPKRGLSW